MFKKSFLILSLSFFIFSCSYNKDEKNKSLDFKIYQISEDVRFKSEMSTAEKIRIWIPLPPDNHSQKIYDLKINYASGIKGYITTEKKYGNSMIYIELKNNNVKTFPIKEPLVNIQYKIIRFKDYGNDIACSQEELTQIRKKFLEEERLGKIDETVRKISTNVLTDSSISRGDIRNASLLGKSFFVYVMNHMIYDKTVEGWGKGDVKRACQVAKGNCTDYHSLFSALMRAVDIPVKFVIGYSIPEGTKSGELKGYHCWAYFLSENRWVPVDISETDKKPEKNLFGYLDFYRFEVSKGRDITLEPAQSGEPLNFFVFPYCEVDDKNIDCLQTGVRFEVLH